MDPFYKKTLEKYILGFDYSFVSNMIDGWMVLVLHREPAVPRNPLPLLRVAQEVPQGPTVPTSPDSPCRDCLWCRDCLGQGTRGSLKDSHSRTMSNVFSTKFHLLLSKGTVRAVVPFLLDLRSRRVIGMDLFIETL